jgi:hypothetical protein
VTKAVAAVVFGWHAHWRRRRRRASMLNESFTTQNRIKQSKNIEKNKWLRVYML